MDEEDKVQFNYKNIDFQLIIQLNTTTVTTHD